MDTKRQILEATITCIERKGLHNTTIRDIAAEAEVNIAAINYHFRTKQALIEQVMRLTLETGMEDFRAILLTPGAPFRQRLQRFLTAVIEGSARFPNLARAHLYGTLMNGEEPGPYIVAFRELLDEAIETAAPEDTLLDRPELVRAIESAMFAALLRCLSPCMFDLQGAGPPDPKDEARRLMRLFPI